MRNYFLMLREWSNGLNKEILKLCYGLPVLSIKIVVFINKPKIKAFCLIMAKLFIGGMAKDPFWTFLIPKLKSGGKAWWKA